MSQKGVSEVKTPHSVSLKVLRLSRPTFATQVPLPKQSSEKKSHIDRRAALSYASLPEAENFQLSPLLTLPTSFGIVHVGETLTATVCVSNELAVQGKDDLRISEVRLTAEVQTPSQQDNPVALDLVEPSQQYEDEGQKELAPGETQQRILSFALREEGNHILAITASYHETNAEQGNQSSGRTRTFRKLYQFSAQHLLSVRTKTRTLPYGRNPYIVEAQMENLGDQAVVLESVKITTTPGFTSRSFNAWNIPEDVATAGGDENVSRPTLRPRNILQVAFMLEPKDASSNDASTMEEQASAKENNITLGQISIQWRGPMGDQGLLNTSWLTGKRFEIAA